MKTFAKIYPTFAALSVAGVIAYAIIHGYQYLAAAFLLALQ